MTYRKVISSKKYHMQFIIQIDGLKAVSYSMYMIMMHCAQVQNRSFCRDRF